jgi:hypothetical protein
MALARNKSFIGINKETAHAAGVAPTPAAPAASGGYIPVTSITPFDNIKYLEDKNWRGSMVEDYGIVQGNIYSEFEFGGDVFADTIGWPVAGVLGDVTTTGSAAPYTHAIALKNSGNGQTTSYTITDYNGVNARRFAGLQFHEIDFKFNADALLTYTAKGSGFQSDTSGTTSGNSYSAVVPTASWTGTTTIGGTTKLILEEGNCLISRPVNPIWTIDANQSPYQLFQGPVSVSGSLTFVVEDDTQLQNYLSNSQPSLQINFTTGSGATATQVQLNMTKCAFVVAKIDRGSDYVQLKVDYKAIGNATDVGASAGYSPIKVTLQNAIAASVYV